MPKSNSTNQNIIAIANQKGGVGKTTTAVNLATALAACKKRVLLLDLDPQGNASTGFGISKTEAFNTAYDLMNGDKSINECNRASYVKYLDIIPADMNLSGLDIELADHPHKHDILKRALASNDTPYDYVFIDCPPGLNVLTSNALCAAQSVLIPLQCEFYALEGIAHLMSTIKHIRQNLNQNLQIFGIVLTMYDKRNRLCMQVSNDIRDHFSDKVFNTVIPRNVRVSEAPSHGKPVILYDFACTGSQAYIRLAKEFLDRALT